MPITSVTDLVTLAQAKTWLGIDDSDDSMDETLSRAISAASLAVANYCGTDFTSAARNEVRDGDGRSILYTKFWPITAISSVQIDGITIPASSGISQVGRAFDETRIVLRGYVFTPGMMNVVLAYTAGYATIPAQVIQAALYATSAIYNAQSVDPNVTSESVPGVYSASYAQGMASGAAGPAAGTLPMNARSLLEPFRRMFSP